MVKFWLNTMFMMKPVTILLYPWNYNKSGNVFNCMFLSCTRFRVNPRSIVTRTYSQMHRADKYSQLSSII